MSYCGLCAALVSSADKAKRGPLSKQRNAHLQTVPIEASKLAPRWNQQLAEVHQRELKRGGDRNQATLAVDQSGKPFEVRKPAENPVAEEAAQSSPAGKSPRPGSVRPSND